MATCFREAERGQEVDTRGQIHIQVQIVLIEAKKEAITGFLTDSSSLVTDGMTQQNEAIDEMLRCIWNVLTSQL